MLRTDDFNPDQPREANGQFGSGGGGAKKEEAKGGGKAGSLKDKHAKAVAEYENAKALLAYAVKNGAPDEIAAAKAANKAAGKKVAAIKHVMKKLEPAAPPKEEPKPELKPEPPKPEPHPKAGSTEAKHEASLKEYAAAKAALDEAKKSGDAAKVAEAKAAHVKAGKKAAALKHILKKMENGGYVTKGPPGPAPKAPHPPSPHGLGNTVTVKGKTEAGGPLVGTVVGSHPDGKHTMFLQLGKSEAEWHAHDALEKYEPKSAWAKEKAALGTKVAKALGEGGGGPLDKKMSLASEVKQAQGVSSAKPQKSSTPIPKEKAGPDAAKIAPKAWGQTHYKEWQKSLAANEKAAIKSYTNGHFSSLNGFLRTGGDPKGGTSTSLKEKINAIDSALAKSPGLPHDMTLMRGVNGSFPIEVGDTYHDKGYMSTSLGDGFGGSNKFVISAPKGTKGAYFDSGLSSYENSEKEFLLPRGSKFKVTKVEQKGGVRFIHGDLVVDEGGHPKKDEREHWEELTEAERRELERQEPAQADLSRNPRFVSSPGEFTITKGE